MSEIKKFFKSRFRDGYIIEADYSQLEIYGLAHLSGDKQLKQDLLNGKDLHAISAEALFGKHFTSQDRKTAKQLSFQLQYGSGPKSMSIKNDIPIQLARKFIDNYYARYPDVADYYGNLIKEIRENRKVISDDSRTPNGYPQGVSHYHSPTGRKFVFKEYDAPEWSRENTSFRPTEIKNYKTQGFAGGDIVMTALGRIFRELKQDENRRKELMLINTVHDSIVADTSYPWLEDNCMFLQRHMENVPKYLKEDYGIEFDLPLKVGIKYGKNWLEMVDYTAPF